MSPPILDPDNVDTLDIQLVDNLTQGAAPTTVVFIETAANSRAFESQDGTVYVRFDSSFGTDPAETPTIPRIHGATVQAHEASRAHVWATDLVETGVLTGTYRSSDTSLHAVATDGLRTDAADTISAELSPVFGSLANLELTETASDSLEFTDAQGDSLRLFHLGEGEAEQDPFGELLFILSTAGGDVSGGVIERDVAAEGPGEWCLKTSPVVYSKPTTTAIPCNGSGSVVFRARVLGYPDLLPPQRPSRIRIHAAPEFLEEEPISVTTSSGTTFSIDMTIEEGVLTSGPVVVDCQAKGDIEQVLDGWPVKIWGNILGEQDPPEYVRLTFKAPDGSTVHSRGPVQVLAPDDEDHTTMRMDGGGGAEAAARMA